MMFLLTLLLALIRARAQTVCDTGINATLNTETFPPLCGDCFCIPEPGESCPFDLEPETNFTSILSHLRTPMLSNPMSLASCDPFTDNQCETVPPRVDLGVDAVCGIQYSEERDAEYCPLSYTLHTFASKEDATEQSYEVTHYGGCSVCSSIQDLAAYMEYPKLADKGIECSIRLLTNSFESGVACYQEVGFSKPCATMWVYNSLNTNKFCTSTCLPLLNTPANGPPPDCVLNDCIQCDVDNSEPVFLAYAGRTRRDSGLLSGILRRCRDLVQVEHRDPCVKVVTPSGKGKKKGGAGGTKKSSVKKSTGMSSRRAKARKPAH